MNSKMSLQDAKTDEDDTLVAEISTLGDKLSYAADVANDINNTNSEELNAKDGVHFDSRHNKLCIIIEKDIAELIDTNLRYKIVTSQIYILDRKIPNRCNPIVLQDLSHLKELNEYFRSKKIFIKCDRYDSSAHWTVISTAKMTPDELEKLYRVRFDSWCTIC